MVAISWSPSIRPPFSPTSTTPVGIAVERDADVGIVRHDVLLQQRRDGSSRSCR